MSADKEEIESDEDEFLELIDVEEDSFAEEKIEEKWEEEEYNDAIIQFDEPKSEIEDVDLKDFINDSLDEEIPIDDDLEDELGQGGLANPRIILENLGNSRLLICQAPNDLRFWPKPA